MKKAILILMIIISNYVFSYNFPISDPYSATIIGSSTIMTPNVSEEVPTKVYSVKIKKKVPEIFWYAENFEFSLTAQKKEAPLIFVLAGTGSDYKSVRMKYFERILYDAGFSVISISSPMSAQFLISASKYSVPGLLLQDNSDTYKAMKLAYERIKDKVKVTDFYVMGYSLGGTNSAVISYIDESEKYFNFKRVFLINPAVELYSSAKKLDSYLDEFTRGDTSKIEYLIENVLNRMKNNMKNEYTNIDSETIFSLISGDFLTEAEKKAFIGLAFRITSVDLNFISDVITKSNVYTKEGEKLNKYTSLFENFKRIDFASFEDYVDKVGFPYYKKQNENFTMEDLNKEASLKIIDEYIRNSDKIFTVTNEDELILSKEDLRYLKDVFKDKIKVYPTGGHCGNMFYYENVSLMINFLKNGVLDDEK
ncbi:MAG: serine/threonine protein kinase [Fusobacterium sp.]|uniref:serine/threonine protein kinase n=1 Tax=Fusobacterium sp. TaxID=68766 RepID=UPI0026DC9207|nr:serine/threonine protein kinase [Fusobacterium sp.]MDO4689970.1 serine/threonine protein kinase [Fusobacterium sp.]